MSQATIQSQLLISRINFLLVEIPIPHIRNSYYLPILDINNLLVSSDLRYVKLICDIDMWNVFLNQQLILNGSLWWHLISENTITDKKNILDINIFLIIYIDILDINIVTSGNIIPDIKNSYPEKE